MADRAHYDHYKDGLPIFSRAEIAKIKRWCAKQVQLQIGVHA